MCNISRVTSRLDYRNEPLCGITDELQCRLRKVQNNSARVVSCSKKYHYITQILKDLHWLTIRKMIEFKILHVTLKMHARMCSSVLDARNLRSNTEKLLHIPHTNPKRVW